MPAKHHTEQKTSPNHIWITPLPYFITLAIGMGVVSLFSILSPRLMRCTPLNDIPSWLGQAVFLAISQLLAPLISLIIPKIPGIKAPQQKILVTITIVAGIITFLFVRFGLPIPADTVCYPELKVIYGLIDAEKNAVLNKDMSQIDAIFLPDAVIENIALNRMWGNPSLFYGPKFKDETHCSITHSHYTVMQLTSTEAIITTASSGTWGPTLNGNGCSEAYNNPAGSDYWSFTKIESQWMISGFRFNCYAAPDKCKP
jgi:hypothetical protein